MLDLIVSCINSTAEIESIIQPWEDSDSLACSYYISVQGEPATFCNDR